MTAAKSVMEPLPTLPEQAERLLELGVHRLAGWPEKRLRGVAEAAAGKGSLLAIHPDAVAASMLVPLLNLSGKQGFLVVDMPDVDEFVPTVELPDSPVYLVDGIDRGDAMANWSPDEADPAIAAASRTPLTLTEGLHWLLQRPETLQRGRCFMTIGSRKPSRAARWMPGPRRSGSATAPGATARTTGTRRRSAGAGRAIGTPGWASHQPRVAGWSARWADSTNGSTASSQALGSPAKTT